MAETMFYRGIAYYRLSEKDKEKSVSDSIENQKKLIREYVSKQDNIRLVKEIYDDGYTGTNYDRPGFCAVLESIKAGDADCIIVKDLSRLGREYIETGKYIERVFPGLGVRFIAVNDDYDSDNPRQSDDIIVPVKNLMNETYCRELSIKLRRQFVVQRRNGEYIGAFASYGYCKAPDDKHKLVVDEYAAEIVRDIFYAKMQGYSQQAIAATLNKEGVLCPSEYKKQQGLNYKSGFKTSLKSQWTTMSITNILRNRLYIGELIQGKRGTPNFKIKKVRERKPEEWIVVKNNHEPIMDALVFDIVQKMMGRDTRTSPSRETVLPLGGVLFCADCNKSMCLRTVTHGNKKFSYYICNSYKRGEGCDSHSMERSMLESVVLTAIQAQIRMVVELDELISSISSSDIHAIRLKKVDFQIEEKRKELDGYKEFRSRLFEALNDNLIDRDEFGRMRSKYQLLEAQCEQAISHLNEKRAEIESDPYSDRSWIDQYIKYRELKTLSHEAVVSLIDRILISNDKTIEIVFNYKDEIAYFADVTQNSLQEVG